MDTINTLNISTKVTFRSLRIISKKRTRKATRKLKLFFRVAFFMLIAIFFSSLAIALEPKQQVQWVPPITATAQTEQVYDRSFANHSEDDSVALRTHAKKRVGWRQKGFEKTTLAEFKILGFNDFHGALEAVSVAGRPAGGAAVLASYLHSASSANDGEAIIVHAGDHVGASPPISALFQDEPAIEFLNLVGNSFCQSRFKQHPKCNLVGTLGNHEFDDGVDEMLRLVNGGNHAKGPFLRQTYRGANFPYVNANVVYEATGRYVLPPYVIKWVSGQRVAFVGAVLKETPSIVTPTGVAGVSFLDEAESINKLVPHLQRIGVKAIVVTIHQGTRQAAFDGNNDEQAQALAGDIGDIVKNLDSEIDIVVTGHAHGFTNQLVNNNHGKSILVTQAFSNGTAYADISVAIDKLSGDIVAKSSEIITTWADEGPGLTPDSRVAAMVAKAKEMVQPRVERVVGVAAMDIAREQTSSGESALGNLIADAQRTAMNADIAFMNPGGIRADLDSGEVTWGELFTLQPFANDLIQMNLTGAQIITLLNQQWSGANASSPRLLKTSGIHYTWDAALPIDNRVLVDSVIVAGAALNTAATYSVVVNSFIAAGGDNFPLLVDGTERVVGPVDLDALIDFIGASQQPFSARIEGRISKLN